MRWLVGLIIFCFLSFAASACGKGVCTPRIAGDRRITMSYLGKIGRFGNQVFQYIFLKTYAKRHHLETEAPKWIGNELFGANDPEISTYFCEARETVDLIHSYEKKNQKVFVNVDLNGYFLYHTSVHKKDQAYIRKLFEPTAEFKSQLNPLISQLKTRGNTLVSIHLRRGDFGKPPFVISPASWYVTWLKALWPTLDHPVLFLASDDLNLVLPDFADFNPVTIRDLKFSFSLIKSADYYPEFYILTQSDVLAVSNSTFSTAAALLNEKGKLFYRPDFAKKIMVPFDPWDTWPMESWHK